MKKISPFISALVACLCSCIAGAATLSTGSAVVSYDAAAWASLAGGANLPGFEAMILDEFFDQAAANSRTSAQILADEVVAGPSPLGLVHTMNGSVVTNLAGRTAQPTTFDFTPGNLTAHTGVIGLGGVSRWALNPLLGGKLVAGDYTLSYDPARQLVGGSGWAISNHIAPAGVVFDLVNVSVTDLPGSISVSGDLALSYEVANFILNNPSDQGRDMGSFSFTGTVVPEPCSGLLCTAAFAGILRRRRR